MSNYEYLGKKEIYKRVQALGYEMPKLKDSVTYKVTDFFLTNCQIFTSLTSHNS